MKSASASLRVYLGLVVTLFVLRILLAFWLPESVISAQAGVLTWSALVIAGGLGGVGLWLSARTGFPGMWDYTLSLTRRFCIPLGLGLGAGFVFLLVGRSPSLVPLRAATIPFPVSLPFYLYGGIVSEILFRLFLVPLPLWVVSSLILKDRWQELAFWGVALVTSGLEPLGQVGALYQLGMLDGDLPPTVSLLLALTYGVNLLSTYLFRKMGFLASVTMRVGHYLVWHMIF